ncbi:MAG: adenylate/guanylate cyclase domain-containing protein, partial [Verrucomicrobiota bacterium]|nr:adenylate/guanylate cyclase domain-containing protein [Verrucomicrobiota bacterium]
MLADDLNLAGATSKRTLATIVFTDAVGFSERMSRDESGTLDLLRQDFDRIRKACARHHGEVIKSTGDGLLMYFSSAVGAVSCAVEIQTEHALRRTNEKDSLEHRIGIHLGDVFVHESDVMGDGVNIAARLQYEAEPGGICISQTVYDVVKNTLALKTTSLGPRELKNLSQKLTLYQVLLGADQSSNQARIQPKRLEQRRFHRFNFYPIIALLFAVLLGGALFFFWKKTPPPWAEMSPAIEPFKSIAVLPFVNMSDDQTNGYFARGIHEDILTQLAKVLDLKIISRTSVMQYSEHTGSLRSIGEALGAAVILEGSVRREGNRVRFTAQLINAKNDHHLWAETYDRDLTDVFAIQSAVAQEIVTALRAHLSPQEKERIERKPTENSQAYDFYLQARDYYSRPGNLAENFSNAE